MFGNHRLRAWGALGSCVFAAAAGAQSSSSAPAKADCSEIEVIDLHGSGAGSYTQSPPGVKFKEKLQMQLPSRQVTVETVPFEAAGGPIKLAGAALKLPRGYYKSVTRMKGWVRGRLQSLARDCPGTKVLLSGYSQGAQAVGDVYQEQAWPQVVGVVLFGDPYFNHADSSNRFGLNVKLKRRIKTRLDGALAASKPRKAFNSQLVWSYCHQEDFVCQSLSKYELLEYKTGQHTNYTGFGEPETAAEHFAKLLAGGRSTKPPPRSAEKWPTNRHDGTTKFFITLGTYGIGPAWTSCDADYCIAGASDKVYLFVHNGGYYPIGAIPISDANPRKELANLGVPERDIDQLLAP